MTPTRVEPAGVLLVDKPAGSTSHDVVRAARRALGLRRVGHTGTLDPFATGLLLLCLGPTTRLAEYFHLLPKDYVATLRLGVETNTGDATGESTSTSDSWRELERGTLLDALAAHTGRLLQRPPAFSAKRVGGVRAYRTARAGGRPRLDAVPVTVHSLELLSFELPMVRLRARVSTGTYLRALARDIGREVGCGAHLAELRRTAIGPFQVKDAISTAALRRMEGAGSSGAGGGETWWLSPAAALRWLPGRELDEGELRRVQAGRKVPAGHIRLPETDLALPAIRPDPAGEGTLPVVLLSGGRLVAVAEVVGRDLQPRKVLGGG